MIDQTTQLDHELVNWRAESLICDLYQVIYEQLKDHPILEAVRLLENLHVFHKAVHGLDPGIETAYPGGLWGELAHWCEQAGWELARLELAWVQETKARQEAEGDADAGG